MSIIPLSEAKAKLARLLTEVDELGERVIITRSGRPVGVLLPVDEYEGLLETLEILADPELSRAVRRGLAEAEAGELVEHEAVWAEAGELEAPLRP
jgi:prevent-host-death family protein